jgi:hypothetical protein
MCAGACRGIAKKTTFTHSKGCARQAGRAEDRLSHSRGMG